MSVSTRTRFEIFKRDGFRCVYCGAAPTSTVLHVDHVVPKSKGGSDDPSNLVTSCQSCNGGKSNVRLEDNRHSSAMNVDMAKDHVEAMEIAAAKFHTPYQRRTKAFKYFCGIVRRWRETGIVSRYPSGSAS